METRPEGILKRADLGVEKLKIVDRGCGGRGCYSAWYEILCGNDETIFGKRLRVGYSTCLKDDQQRQKPDLQNQAPLQVPV